MRVGIRGDTMGHRGGLVDARRLMSLLLLENQGDADCGRNA